MEMKSILAVPFNTNNYNNFVLEFFNEIDKVAYREIKPNATFANAIEYYSVHGTYKDPEGNDIIVLSVKVKNNSKARQAQRNFVSYLLTNDFNQYSAAMVAYYDDVRTNWKLSFVTVEMELGDNGIELKFKPAKRFSFLVGENEPTRTYTQQLGPIYTSRENPTLERITDAFSVNKLSKDFYEDYKKKFFELVDYLKLDENFINESHKLGYTDSNKFAITFAKKTLGQMVFLHFIQKKGWLGVHKIWGDGNKQYLIDSTKIFKGENYFNDFLEPLFYCALNKKRNDDMYLNSKIPFLNGGLFNPIESYDWENTNFNIPNNYWFNDNENGLLDILRQYNFTVDEADPTEQEVAVDPEMLGKIFESLLDVKDRSSLGAFYTPREIVHYMCEEALATKISNELKLDYDSMLNYIRYGDALKETDFIKEFASDIDDIVSKFTIVDPAAGSGAFLVGMLNQIVRLRTNLFEYLNKKVDVYSIKLEAIENSLYGVDVEFDAIEIAKLRLWLSLIVDQNASDCAPHPLPNLNFHLRVGNSLVDVYQGITLWNPKWRSTKEKKRSFIQTDLFNTDTVDRILHRLKKAKNEYFLTYDEKEKQKLAKIIEREQIELIRSELIAKGLYDIFDELEDLLKKKTKPFFVWELEFSEVFENGGGFDIVIANPPYVSTASQMLDPVLLKQREEIINSKKYDCLFSKWDLYIPFVELGMNLLKENGNVAMIIPYPVTNQIYAKKLREKLLDKYNVTEIVDLKGIKVFEATVQNCILFITKEESKKYSMISGMENGVIKRKIKQTHSNLIQDAKTLVWNLSDEERDIQKYSSLNTLGDFFYISKGMVLNADEKKAKGEFKKKDLISLKKDEIHCKKFIEGKDIDKYVINRIRYLEWGTKRSPFQLSRPTFEELYTNKKLLFNCLGEMKVSIDLYGDLYCEQAIRVAVPWHMLKGVENKSIAGVVKKYGKYTRNEMENLSQRIDMKYVLGIVNSKKGKELLTSIRGGDYHIVPEHIRAIPIPLCSKEKQIEVIKIVDDLIGNPVMNEALIYKLDVLVDSLYVNEK